MNIFIFLTLFLQVSLSVNALPEAHELEERVWWLPKPTTTRRVTATTRTPTPTTTRLSTSSPYEIVRPTYGIPLKPWPTLDFPPLARFSQIPPVPAPKCRFRFIWPPYVHYAPPSPRPTDYNLTQARLLDRDKCAARCLANIDQVPSYQCGFHLAEATFWGGTWCLSTSTLVPSQSNGTLLTEKESMWDCAPPPLEPGIPYPNAPKPFDIGAGVAYNYVN